MAELDYAYLAEYAKVSGGLLTTVGASYTHIQVPGVPTGFPLYIAGRVRVTVGEEPRLSVTISGPDDIYQFTQDGLLISAEPGRPYGDNKLGLLFTLNSPIPLVQPGLYKVAISIDGELVRTLMFSVEVRSA